MSLSVHEIGVILKKLRKQNELTGEALGERVGISQSKLSKIETGFYPKLQAGEIEKILNILEAPQTIRQQVMHAIGENAYNDPVRFDIFPGGRCNDMYQLEKQSSIINIFCIGLAPMLLQLPGYREACLAGCGLNAQQISEDLRLATKRQDLLWDRAHKFTFIMSQAALYTLIATRAVQVAQLDRLERMVRTSHVKIGIIPLEAGLVVTENGSFAVYDRKRAVQMVAYGEIEISDMPKIALLSEVFASLEKLACYDQRAIDLIRQAADYFTK